MTPKDLLTQADYLAKLSPMRPKQANLRRSVSSAYYAVFHAMCLSNANCLIGTGSRKPENAWIQAYRAIDHGKAKASCKTVANMSFPKEIKDFANAFISLQEHRHRADYNPDPSTNFSKAEVFKLITGARKAVAALENASINDRRAFAVHLLLPNRS